ncbi:hypothetical protein [Prosthecobacter sp.]|uniref:hypothetical protein n=1 Tax=Prosthecobacter sp. TaxID=1965333 RepID=UPI003784E7B5
MCLIHATSSTKRLALCLVMAAFAALGAGSDDYPQLSWKPTFGLRYGITRQERLEGIRRAFSKLVQGKELVAVMECGMDFELPSMLSMIKEPAVFALGSGVPYSLLPDAVALRSFRFNPSINVGWMPLADNPPPGYATDYHAMVIRQTHAWAFWKSEADSRLIETLQSSDDPGFRQILEWYQKRSKR